ncbi:hypothetical protein D1AOALGA4SA_8396 [Olavius algarvensis Delta 1 endosymbiont]|nr:hypothetical protein D1AOALGA4SA_8396 [Olavius algarvensis Delta 1 endosymbiont]
MNNPIYIPATKPEDWRHLLAEPDKQWRDGYSAKSLAVAWHRDAGFPQEVGRAFDKSGYAIFKNPELLLAIPEHKVPLPGGGNPSQNDLFVLAKGNGQIISMTVEGKVSEPFGPLVSEWFQNPSEGKRKRLAYLCKILGLNANHVSSIRYQLLHRTASAVIEADRFNATNALMLVHSFSPTNKWYDDFEKFSGLYEVQVKLNEIIFAGRVNGTELYLGWVKGDVPKR